MKEGKTSPFVFTHSNPVNASSEQEDYIVSGNYTIKSSEGKTFKRCRELLAFNPLSGNILVKEITASEEHKYEKMFIVSRDGKPEKFKAENF